METSDLLFITDNSFDLKFEDRVCGAYLFDKFNAMVGRIQGVLVEPEDHRVRYAVFRNGGFLFTEGKIVLLPRAHFEMLDMGKARADWSLESLQHAPTVNDLESITRNEERVILSYFDLEPYWEEPAQEDSESTEDKAAESEQETPDFEIPTTGLDEEIPKLDMESEDDTREPS